jgi:hypothetical protein
MNMKIKSNIASRIRVEIEYHFEAFTIIAVSLMICVRLQLK